MAGTRVVTVQDAAIFLYLLLIPLGWSPFPWNLQWADLVFVGLFLTLCATRQLKPWSVRPVDLVMGLYLVGSLASFLRTSDVHQSALEFLKQVSLVGVYFVFGTIGSHPRTCQNILVWYAGIATLLATVTLLAFLAHLAWGISVSWVGDPSSIPVLGRLVRMKGTLHSPALLCNYLTVALPLVIGLAADPHRPGGLRTSWWWVALPILVVVALSTVTSSVVGFLAAGLVSLWGLLASTRFQRVLRAWLAAAIVGLAIVVNLMMLVSVRHVTWSSGTNPQISAPPYVYAFQDHDAGAQELTIQITYNPMSYYLLKRVAVEAFRRAPLTGVGVGTFPMETERAYQQGKLHVPYRAMDPHSTWFGRAAEAGLIGLGGLMLLVGAVGWMARRVSVRPSAGWITRAFAAGCVGLLVNSLNVDILNFRFLWMALGLLRGHDDRSA